MTEDSKTEANTAFQIDLANRLGELEAFKERSVTRQAIERTVFVLVGGALLVWLGVESGWGIPERVRAQIEDAETGEILTKLKESQSNAKRYAEEIQLVHDRLSDTLTVKEMLPKDGMGKFFWYHPGADSGNQTDHPLPSIECGDHRYLFTDKGQILHFINRDGVWKIEQAWAKDDQVKQLRKEIRAR